MTDKLAVGNMLKWCFVDAIAKFLEIRFRQMDTNNVQPNSNWFIFKIDRRLGDGHGRLTGMVWVWRSRRGDSFRRLSNEMRQFPFDVDDRPTRVIHSHSGTATRIKALIQVLFRMTSDVSARELFVTPLPIQNDTIITVSQLTHPLISAIKWFNYFFVNI